MNMLNMIGAGPFFTIPLILAAMVGPQAMLGWILGAVLAVCDGMVWAELSSAIPLSGGTFEYLKIAYLGTPLARLLPFSLIWQFILSGPLEIASGTIGFSQYLTYLLPMSPAVQKWLAAAVTGLGDRAVVSQDRDRRPHDDAALGRHDSDDRGGGGLGAAPLGFGAGLRFPAPGLQPFAGLFLRLGLGHVDVHVQFSRLLLRVLRRRRSPCL